MRKSISIKCPEHTIFVIMILILILVYGTGEIRANKISPEEAIHWGVDNNYDLNLLRNNIAELERNLDILDAAQSFQVDLSVTPIWYFGKGEEDIIEISENSFSPSTEMSLTVTKVLADDINFSTELTWESDSLNQVDFAEITEEINANIKLSKQIYPDTWTENEKQVYNIKNSLQMKLAELRWEEVEKQIEFIQGYLNIIYLQEQVNVNAERVKLAEETLARVRKQIALGEGGYQQETEAQISLEESENQLLSQQQKLSQAKKQWLLTLNLPQDTLVQFEQGTDFLGELYSQMDSLEINQDNQSDLIAAALAKNYQVENSLLEKEALLKELEWTEDEGKMKINLSGGYQFPADWFAMVDFSVNLADGGAQKLKEEQKVTDIQQKEVSIAYLIEQLKLEAEQLLDQDLYCQLYLNTQLLDLEKEQRKAEILEKQYQKGTISETEWKNEVLTLKEKEIKVKSAEDEWFINRLKLAHFVGYLADEI